LCALPAGLGFGRAFLLLADAERAVIQLARIGLGVGEQLGPARLQRVAL